MSKKENNGGGADFFVPMVQGMTSVLESAIKGGLEVIPKMARGFDFSKNKVSLSDMKVELSMLSNKKATLDESHLGWAINLNRPYPLNYFDPGKNTFIVGASGWGKTNLINILQENCLRRNQGIVFIDPKGSLEAINSFKKLCKTYGKKYYIFSEYDIEATSFNPIADMSNSQRISLIMRSFDWGATPNQYYMNEAQKALDTVLSELSKLNQEFDLHDVYKKLKSEHDREEVSGLLSQFQLLLNSDFGKLFKKPANGSPSMTVKRAWEEKACIYLGCSTQGYSSLARTVGKFFVSEVMNLSYWIGKTYDDSHEAMARSFGFFIDEAGSVIVPDILDLANKCRASGINCYFAVQSYSDIEMIAGNEILIKQFFESFANWFIQKQTQSENADKLAAACGTFLAQKMTHAMDNGEESGRGSQREVYEYLCHPDVFKSMNVGQALLLEHGPKSVVLLNIRNARDSKAFRKDNEKKPLEAELIANPKEETLKKGGAWLTN